MMTDAKEYENRELATIKLHLSELPEVEKPASGNSAGATAIQLGEIRIVKFCLGYLP